MSEGLIRGIDIHTYLVKDADRALAFWRDTMELKATKIWEGLGAEFDLGDGSTFGIWKLGEEDGGWIKGNGVMFAVPQIDEAVARYRARGVTVHDPEESPVCRMALAEDSEGNAFILHQRK